MTSLPNAFPDRRQKCDSSPSFYDLPFFAYHGDNCQFYARQNPHEYFGRMDRERRCHINVGRSTVKSTAGWGDTRAENWTHLIKSHHKKKKKLCSLFQVISLRKFDFRFCVEASLQALRMHPHDSSSESLYSSKSERDFFALTGRQHKDEIYA